MGGLLKGAGFILLSICLSIPAFSQNWLVRHYTIDDGMSHNIGYDILQDKQGYMWIGTDNGLDRFDGVIFKHFGSDQIGSPYAISLSDGIDGEIYCATYKQNGGVFRIKDEKIERTSFGETPTFRTTLHHPKIFHYRDEVFSQGNRDDASSRVLIHYEQGKGKEYVFFNRDGRIRREIFANRAAFRETRFKRRNPLESPRPLERIIILVAQSGEMFWATNIGLFQYHGNMQFTKLWEGDFDAIDELPDGRLCLAEKGKLWLGRDTSFSMVFEDSRIDVRELKGNGRGDIMWMNKSRTELFAYSIPAGKCTKVDKRLNSTANFSFLEKDNFGNFWVTTNGSGLYHIKTSPSLNITQKDGLQNHFIHSINQDFDRNLWVGTHNGLRILSQNQRGEWILGDLPNLPEKVKNEEISRIEYLSGITSNLNPSLLVAISAKGFWQYDIITKKWKNLGLFGSPHFEVDQDGFIYMRKGLKKINIFRPQILEVNTIDSLLLELEKIRGFSSFAVINRHDYWLRMHATLLHVKENEVTQYGNKEGLPDSSYYAVAFDPNDKLWVSTHEGLFYFEGGDFFPHPMNDEQKPGSQQLFVFDRNGEMWTGGPQGIIRWQEDNLIHYNRNLGLVSDDVKSLFFDDQNRLWIGTSEGLSMLELPSIRTLSPPKIRLESYQMNGQEVFPQLTTFPNNAQVDLQLSIIEIQNPKELVVQFRLQESDKWTNTISRTFSFSDLRPDAYQLQFRAKTINSDWSEILTFPFEISPPWWLRWWVIVSFVLFLMLISAGLIRWRIRSIAKRTAAQNELNQKMAHFQLSALQSQLNPHFMFNALNAIQYFILNQDEVTANDFLSKFSRLMRLFLEASHERFISLSEELELLELYIQLEQLRFVDKFDYSIQIDPKMNPEDVEIPSMILQPYVENAINHGLRHKEGDGLLQLFFLEKEGKLKITIDDNGVGRARAKEIKEGQNQKRISRGMQLLTDRLKLMNEMMGADIQIQVVDLHGSNGEAKGTRVEIELLL